ncbi:hypothetical protein J3E74DRAFT_296201 [Bipolaris maydis]|nr:hypothetical protein J3E74DRAFT_296201 [Bipolaris maydis]
MHFNILAVVTLLFLTGTSMASDCEVYANLYCEIRAERNPMATPYRCLPTADDPRSVKGPSNNWCRYVNGVSQTKWYCPWVENVADSASRVFGYSGYLLGLVVFKRLEYSTWYLT